MNTIKISNKAITKLKKLNVKSLNIESDLYILENDYLIKLFIEEDYDFLQEKENKINLLINKKIEGTIPILCKVVTNNKFSGYMMPYIKNAIELNELINHNLNKEELINIMFKLSKTLESIHENGIIYGDVSDSNIIVDEKLNPYYADMDGAIIENIGRSNIPKLLFDNKFITDMTPSKGLDIFLLNILFINMLSKQNVSKMAKNELLDVIERLEISTALKTYFSMIISGTYDNYATDILEKELNDKYIRKR